MGWPQIVMLVLMATGFGASAAMHGNPRPNYSIWSSLIAVGLTTWLLIAGGFFPSPF